MYETERQLLMILGDTIDVKVEPVWIDCERAVQFRDQAHKDYPAAYRALILESAYQDCAQ